MGDDERGEKALALSRRMWDVMMSEPELPVRLVAVDLLSTAAIELRSPSRRQDYMNLKRKVLRAIGTDYAK